MPHLKNVNLFIKIGLKFIFAKKYKAFECWGLCLLTPKTALHRRRLAMHLTILF